MDDDTWEHSGLWEEELQREVESIAAANNIQVCDGLTAVLSSYRGHATMLEEFIEPSATKENTLFRY